MPTQLRIRTALLLAILCLGAAGALAACTGDGGNGTLDASDAAASDTAASDTAADTATSPDTRPDASQDTASTDTNTPDTANDVAGDTTIADTAPADTMEPGDTAAPDVLACAAGTEECDGDAANGCESLSSLEHCGACGNDCSGRFAAATAACDAGACAIASCDASFGDCDGVADNGCETDWGPVGGRCCAGGGVQIDLEGGSVRNPNQGVWAIYKNGGALAEDLRCGEDWDTPQVAAALDAENFPVDIVWRRNCPSGAVNDDLRSWYESGQTKGMLFVVYGDDGGEVWRGTVWGVVESYVHLPAGETCTEAEQITLRLLY